MKRKKLLIILMIIPFLKIFSQINQLNPIIDTCAIYSGNMSYNTGEVYVIYTILGNQIVSKQTNQIVSKQTNEIVSSLNEESAIQSISVYPNPVADILTFNTTDNKKVTHIKLYSMDGKIILDKAIENNQIDLTYIIQGTYILKTDFDNSKNFKIIKR